MVFLIPVTFGFLLLEKLVEKTMNCSSDDTLINYFGKIIEGKMNHNLGSFGSI
jgi:hypothetical protein